jgi:hypothetical protein
MPAVTPEGSRWGKFAKLMADHILGDVHGDKPLSIVNSNGVAD